MYIVIAVLFSTQVNHFPHKRQDNYCQAEWGYATECRVADSCLLCNGCWEVVRSSPHEVL